MSLGTIENVIRRKVGNKVYYFGTMSSDMAKAATFVPVIEPSESFLDQKTARGYQRPGKKSRMNAFKRYLDEYPNRLIPPVILSARGYWKFNGDGEIGSLTLEGEAAIVDGQHRVGGLVALYEDKDENRKFDFICFDKLTIEEEKEEFVVINGQQKGVPRALNEYLKGEEDSEIAWMLNTDTNSPLKGKIFRTQAEPLVYFALHSMAKNVKRTFDHGAFVGLDVEDKVEILIQYWKLIAKHNAEAWSDASRPKREQLYKLMELTGIIAWSLVAPEVLRSGFSPESQNFDWDEIEKRIAFMSADFDWDKRGEFDGLTGEVGGRRIANLLQQNLAYYS